MIRTLVLGGLMATATAFGQTGNSPGSRTTPSSGLPNTGTPGSASATNNYNYQGADPAQLFAALDTNKDGRLSKAEFMKIASGTRVERNLSNPAPRTEIRPAEPTPATDKEFNPRVGTGANGSATTTGRTDSTGSGTATKKQQ